MKSGRGYISVALKSAEDVATTLQEGKSSAIQTGSVRRIVQFLYMPVSTVRPRLRLSWAQSLAPFLAYCGIIQDLILPSYLMKLL